MSAVNSTSNPQERKVYNKPRLENGANVDGFGPTSIETMTEGGEIAEEGSFGYSGEVMDLEF